MFVLFFFFFKDTATTEIYTLSLHDALPIWLPAWRRRKAGQLTARRRGAGSSPAEAIRRRTVLGRSEEHTSELQSRGHLVCRLLLEKKNTDIPADPAPKLNRQEGRRSPPTSP